MAQAAYDAPASSLLSRKAEAPGLPVNLSWRALAERLALEPDDIAMATARGRANGTHPYDELLAARLITQNEYFQAVADLLGLEFMTRIEPNLIVMNEDAGLEALSRHADLPPVRYSVDDRALVLWAPARLDPDQAMRLVSARPELARRLRIVTPAALRGALQMRGRTPLTRIAVDGLVRRFPSLSARQVVSGWQAFAAGSLAMATAFFAWFSPAELFVFLHIVASLAFMACVILRIVAAASARPLVLARLPEKTDPASLPVYSVLVALRNEAPIVPELLLALGKLDWPRAKLEIKLICESDDPGTLAALRAHDLHPCVEVIVVPAGDPRTKPKALAYALPQCKGEFVVLYDAEDRPHPQQLREAWSRFSRSDTGLACLQAPLVVSRSKKLFPSLFAFEYAALFRGLLPRLAGWRKLVPLGGTSNHFRREALEAVGGWDPFNVTEDADLGLRLTRCGYRIEMISRPTHEDAPADYATWLPQRTRWFKGWMQTWLVHMRNPRTLLRDLGGTNFILMQILFAGMVLSSLAHVFFVGTILTSTFLLATGTPLPTHHAALLILDLFNVMAGYGAFILLGRRTLSPAERKGFWKVALATPLYWLALSHGAWRAVWHLIVRPHHWEKTSHPPRHRLMPEREELIG
jgi:cellulose synthase/poly-beta-1,6-N-acetylglucosamine synthase-like glycosyltransferase